MNKTMLSVVALAVGAVLIIGLYHIYKPQTNQIASDVFNKPKVALQHSYMNAPKNGTPVKNRIHYMYKGLDIGSNDLKGQFDKPFNTHDLFVPNNHYPWDWNPTLDNSDKFTYGPNGADQYVHVHPNPISFKISFKYNGNVISSHTYTTLDKVAYDDANQYASSNVKSKMNVKDFQIDMSSAKGVPSGYKPVNGNGDYNNGLTYNTPAYAVNNEHVVNLAKK